MALVQTDQCNVYQKTKKKKKKNRENDGLFLCRLSSASTLLYNKMNNTEEMNTVHLKPILIINTAADLDFALRLDSMS